MSSPGRLVSLQRLLPPRQRGTWAAAIGLVLLSPLAARAQGAPGAPSRGASIDAQRRAATAEAREEGPHWLPPLVETAGLFTVMRATEAYLWPNPFSFYRTETWPENYRRAFSSSPQFDGSRPLMTWDGDAWELNVVGHGLLGSELYLRPRRCGFGVLGSIAFATAASAVWEYGFEANGVQPSGVDLWYTPLSGAVLGEGRHLLWQAAGRLSSPLLRGVVRALVDPVGEFSTTLVDSPC